MTLPRARASWWTPGGGRRGRGRAGSAGRLEPAGPGEPGGLGPARRVSFLCGVSCCLPLSCARFASPKSVASWLPPHHPPPSALPLRVGEGSWRLLPVAGPCGPRAQCSLSWSPSERTRIGQRETRATAGPWGLALSGRPRSSFPGAWGPCPPPQEALGSVFTLPLGALGVPLEAAGPPRPDAAADAPSSPCCFSSVLSEILICPPLHRSRPSASCFPSGGPDEIRGRNIFCLPGPCSDPRAVPMGCGRSISSPLLQAPASLVAAPGPATLPWRPGGSRPLPPPAPPARGSSSVLHLGLCILSLRRRLLEGGDGDAGRRAGGDHTPECCHGPSGEL